MGSYEKRLQQFAGVKLAKLTRLKPLVWSMAVAFSPLPVLAQGVALDRELEVTTVTGTRSPLDPNLPASTFSITKEETNNQNMVNMQNALDYAPNMVVRKLKMSDRSGGIATRNSGVGQPMRTLVYADGMLLNNFGGNSHDVARWNTVTPEEVARYDILYGPFSAIYPGNSIGTTVAITTRTPQKLEFSGRLLGYNYTQSNFGIKQKFAGHTENIYLGNRWGDFAASIALENTYANTHGTGYSYLVSPATSSGAAVPVTGAVADTDTAGKPRFIAGTSGMEDSRLQVAKIKLYYDFTPTLTGDLIYNRVFNSTTSNAKTMLRDASGNPVWGGKVNYNGKIYDVGDKGTGMTPREGEEDHQQIGLRLRTRNKQGWNYSVQASDFRMLKSSGWNSASHFGLANKAGTETDGKGTGWNTFEVQATYTPSQELGHALSFGYHQNNYTFKNKTWNLTQWRGSRSTLGSSNEGKTTVQALYAQDSWRFKPGWTLTAGLRAERFEAKDGAETSGSITKFYPKRTLNGLSPKLSLAHEINDQWTVRASYGRGVRFPTAPDLFKGVKVGSELVQPNPNLKAEVSDSKELSVIHETGAMNFRASLYEDDIKDAIWNQQAINAGGTKTSFPTNVDRVRVRGLELAYTQKDLLTPGFDLTGNLTFLNSRVMKNQIDPTVVGNQWVGLPKFRANVLASYRRGDWQGSLGVRHEGQRPRSLGNKEVNHDTYGGSNAYTVADARLSWNFNKWGSMAFGVNNLTDTKYYEFHPYAGRTFFAELKFKY